MDIDLSEIPGENVRKVICETIEKQLHSKKFEVNVSSASKQGENNFLGVIYRVSFNKADELENTSRSSMIVKVAPLDEAQRSQFHSHEYFLQEIFLYNEVLPYFHQFEQSKGIIKEDCFTEYPVCYQTLDAEPNECLLLEDLSVRGFSIIDRFTEEVTADHVYLFIKALGKLHALSFAVKDQQPEKFKELSSNLKDVLQTDGPYLRDYFNKQAKCIMDVLSTEEDAHLLAIVKDLFEVDVTDIVDECLDPKSAGSESVILHGDAWQNNIMYRYDDQRKPIETNLLDWQISGHATPVIDFVCFIFSCTTKELRDAHYNKFLKIYHESLSKHIRRLGSDPEKLFPYSLMEKHLRKFGKIGLIFAALVLPVITAERGNVVDMNDAANSGSLESFDSFVTDNSRAEFNKRLKGVVVDMVQLGYI